MKFIVDTQLPPLLKELLKDKQIDCSHTIDYSIGNFLTDQQIREIAILEDRIIITKDTDFYDYYLINSFPPKVLLLTLGNTKNRALLDYFRSNIDKIIKQFSFEEVGLVVCTPSKIFSL
jgi:predicted nuclease of predicted toxin-antitoxin system